MKKLVLLTIFVLSLAACQPGQNASQTEETVLEPEPVSEQEPQEVRRRYQPRERPEREPEPVRLETQEQLLPQVTEGMLDQDGPGLSIMIDASNRDAFHQSMALIATETSESQYSELEDAVELLSFYDMDAHAGEGLLQVLNGMTGDEVIDRARKIRYGE